MTTGRTCRCCRLPGMPCCSRCARLTQRFAVGPISSGVPRSGRFLVGRGVEVPTADAPQLAFAAESISTADVAEAVEALSAAAGRWSGANANVAIIDSAMLDEEAIARFIRLGWDLVVEMNSQTDVVGCWANAKVRHRAGPPAQAAGPGSDLWQEQHAVARGRRAERRRSCQSRR